MTSKPWLFQPGQSGNPGGAKPQHPEIRAAFKAAAGEALNLALKVMRDRKATRKDKLAAARMVLEWGLSKPAPDGGGGAADALQAYIEAMKQKA